MSTFSDTNEASHHQPYTVLVYGDSNTWGYDPDTPYRYPYSQRWITRLQKAFKNQVNENDEPEALIVGEGMNGRTTIFSKQRKEPIPAANDYDRSGRVTFVQTLQSHKPIDLIVIALGTNDFNLACEHHRKVDEGETVEERILRGIRTLVEDARSVGNAIGNFYPIGKKDKVISVPPKIMVCSTPTLKTTKTNRSWEFPENLEELCVSYNRLLPVLCHEIGVEYLDISQVTSVSDTDGIHLRLQDQEPLAKLMEEKIREIMMNTSHLCK